MRTAIALTLTHFLWQGAILAAISAVTLRALNRARPETRYAVACLTLLLMAAAPAVTLLYLTGRASTPLTISARAVDAILVVPGVLATAPASHWSDWILLAWLCGATLCALRNAGGLALATWRMTTGRTADLGLQTRVDRLAGLAGMTRRVSAYLSDRVTVPSVIGVLRPVVVVPVSTLLQLTPSQLDAILSHELAHIARHDFLVNCLQSVVEAALLYHPAVWWISARMRQERELCCDAAAVSASGGDAKGYARALLTLAESSHLAAAVPAATSGDLHARIARLLGVPQSAAPASAARMAGVLLVLTAALAAGLIARPADPPPPPPPPAPKAQPAPLPAKAPRSAVQPRKASMPPPPPPPPPLPATAERDRRINYARERFAGDDTSRGRIYVQYGPPDEIEVHTRESRENWLYRNTGTEFEFTGEKPELTRVRFDGQDYRRVQPSSGGKK